MEDRHNSFACRSCGAEYPFRDGFPSIITDPRLRTRLEDIDYNQVHGVSDVLRQQTAAEWGRILERVSCKKNKLLEIGAGTGLLTWGLLHQSDFREIYVTDISSKFLKHIHDVIEPGAKNAARYLLCDANNIQFRDGLFDVVVGNSVLHHFLDYRNCLRASRRALKEDGVAIFLEPTIQGKVWIAQMADLMLRIDAAFDMKLFNQEEGARINHLINHQTKEKILQAAPEKRAAMEDKYIFNKNEMPRIAEEAGFSGLTQLNARAVDPSFRSYVQFHLAGIGINKKKLNHFEFLFHSFERTIAAALPDQVTTPMCYYIFHP